MTPDKLPTARRFDDVDRIIGGEIRKYRLARGLSQEELARHIGLSFQQVQKYENGTNRIPSSRLYRICKILDVEAGEIFSQVDEAGKPGKRPVIGDAEHEKIYKLYNKIQNPDTRKKLLTIMKVFADT